MKPWRTIFHVVLPGSEGPWLTYPHFTSTPLRLDHVAGNRPLVCSFFWLFAALLHSFSSRQLPTLNLCCSRFFTGNPGSFPISFCWNAYWPMQTMLCWSFPYHVLSSPYCSPSPTQDAQPSALQSLQRVKKDAPEAAIFHRENSVDGGFQRWFYLHWQDANASKTLHRKKTYHWLWQNTAIISIGTS